MTLFMRALPYLVAVALVLGGLAYVYNLGAEHEAARWQARTSAALADAMGRAAQAQDKARAAEQASAQAMATIDNAYQQGRTDAQNDFDRTIADRDSGAIRLRDRFTCTDSTAASGLPKAGTTTGQRDAGTARGLQRTDEEFFIRFARRADEVTRQLAACQAVVRADRAQ